MDVRKTKITVGEECEIIKVIEGCDSFKSIRENDWVLNVSDLNTFKINHLSKLLKSDLQLEYVKLANLGLMYDIEWEVDDTVNPLLLNINRNVKVGKEYGKQFSTLWVIGISKEEYELETLMISFLDAFTRDAMPRFYAIFQYFEHFNFFINFVKEFASLKLNNTHLESAILSYNRYYPMSLLMPGSNSKLTTKTMMINMKKEFEQIKGSSLNRHPILEEHFINHINISFKNLIISIVRHTIHINKKSFQEEMTSTTNRV